ncbi:hypothetical protein [Nocardia mangyaensis]|jgi:hypothetical protein|nr:hypothetical protein [Nocardia mangyaensis]
MANEMITDHRIIWRDLPEPTRDAVEECGGAWRASDNPWTTSQSSR